MRVIEHGAVRLWHPVRARPDEREQWRALVWAEHLRQPFAQVFREHYAVEGADAAAAFTGFEVDLRPFVGTALSQGWRVDHEGALARRLGKALITVQLDGPVYPGIQGSDVIRRISVTVAGEEVSFSAVPEALASEALRAIDLLVSIGAIEEIEVEARALSSRAGSRSVDSVAVRRIVLEHVYASEPRVTIEGRRARVGAYSVHLGTARVTRDGDPVTLPERKPPQRSFVASGERVLTAVLDAIDHLLLL